MCGRYALALRAWQARRALEGSSMPSQDVPNDDDIRTTHNFAPGYYGLVYRADTPPPSECEHHKRGLDAHEGSPKQSAEQHAEPQYKLQAMKWGLVPFWTKKNPDYGSMMKTINCRDDSLEQSGGMWQHVKKKRRCVVVAQGFYEWLRKNNGKEKIPHFVKRKDGQLMCFAGMYDRVKFEDADNELYTYTIITTNSNKQLSFLHDRMPVILNNGSKEMFMWLDPSQQDWTPELQTLLKPFDAELECYPVPKEVGKVGNDSASFIVPLQENKQSINNFFANQKKSPNVQSPSLENGIDKNKSQSSLSVEDNKRQNSQSLEPKKSSPQPSTGKRDTKSRNDEEANHPDEKRSKIHTTPSSSPIKSSMNKSKGMLNTKKHSSPAKSSPEKQAVGDGSMKITSFFSK